ncbi:MAG: D-glycerate dehydrogenase [Pseudomonadota bacterium]
MSPKPTVLVSRRLPAAVETRLERDYTVTLNRDDVPLSAADFRDALQRYDALLPTVTDRLEASVFDGITPKTRVLANYGVGYSHIDDAAARDRGLVVTNTPDVLSECTADIAMTLLLMVARRAGEGERELRAQAWHGWYPTHLLGTKVSGKTLGIVGFGRIGQAMAQRAHGGFGMRILVHNRSAVDPAVLARYGAEQMPSLESLLARGDMVSLHCPGGVANRHLLDAERLATLPRHAVLINTARGEVVDEDALAAALQSGALGGAGLDVYDGEPAVRPALLASPNAVLLPHLGSATAETRDAMGFRVLDNLDAFFAGREPRDRVI